MKLCSTITTVCAAVVIVNGDGCTSQRTGANEEKTDVTKTGWN